MAESPASTAIRLGRHSYGKSEVRMVKLNRGAERHTLRDLNVAVALEGDFAAAYLSDDNTQLPATDTMRNVVYALAQQHLLASSEAFGLALVEHFLRIPAVSAARISLVEYPWERISVAGEGHPHAFTRGAGERTSVVAGDKTGVRSVEAGIDNLLVLKTTGSGWADFYRDEYTTLPDSDDRILATVITANWAYDLDTVPDYEPLWAEVREQILTSFCDHYSPSVQHTLYRIGHAVLSRFNAITRISLSFPNKHHLRYDLERFGLENRNEVFQATSEPYGLIEGTLVRDEG
jgi:urate oxidase